MLVSMRVLILMDKLKVNSKVQISQDLKAGLLRLKVKLLVPLLKEDQPKLKDMPRARIRQELSLLLREVQLARLKVK